MICLGRAAAGRVGRLLLPLFLVSAALAASAADEGKPVVLSDTPPPVQKAIAAQIGDGKLEEISQTNDGGEAVFDVSLTGKNGETRGFSVADDGTILSLEVPLAETPAPVQRTIAGQVAGWTLAGIDRILDETEPAFDVELTKDGRDKTFSVAADGRLLSRELALDEAPAAVQAAIKSQVGDGSLKSVDETLDLDGNTFDVAVVLKNGVTRSFTLAEDGSERSEQVPLEQVPPPARKTILDQIGGGKILRIDHALLQREKGVLPYEVEGRKDGKRLYFSVGPHGRYLGLND